MQLYYYNTLFNNPQNADSGEKDFFNEEMGPIISGIPTIPGVTVPGVPNLYAGMLDTMGHPYIPMQQP